MRKATKEYGWCTRALESRYFALAFGRSVKGDRSTNDCYGTKPTNDPADNRRGAAGRGSVLGSSLCPICEYME